MNCMNIADILDSGDSRRLSTAERREVDAHLDTCRECRAEFAAHEAMAAMAVPAMSPGLAARSRRLVVAQSASRTRPAGARSFIVVGLLVAGAAAAAFVGVSMLGGSGETGNIAVEAVVDAEPVATAVPPSAVEPVDTGTAAAPVENAVDAAAASGGFTVAVTPMNIDAAPAAGSVYRQFLAELRKLPNLELVELEARQILSTSASGVAPFGVVTHQESVTTVEARPPGLEAGRTALNLESAGVTTVIGGANIRGLQDTGGANTLVLVDSRGVGAGRDGEVDLSAVPTALVGRIETITGGASAAYGADAMSGVVNVILDNNIEGVRVDLNYSTATLTHAVEAMAHDYALDVTATGTDSPDAWNFHLRARSRSGGSFSVGGGLRASDPDATAAFIEQTIAQLQAVMFPLDATTIAAIEARVRDTSLSLDERLRELARLRQVIERSGNSRLADDVALAVVDMASRASDERQRRELFQALMGIDNPVLIEPLSNALRNDSNEAVRLQAVLVLAGFQRDPRAQAALEAAANADSSLDVRKNARWAALDAAGHRNLIVSSILDTRLADAERIDPLLFDLRWANGPQVELGTAIDATVANELAVLLRRYDNVPARSRVLMRLQNEASPAVTALFVERLREDAAEGVRMTAAQALYSRLDEPGVRYALERAAVDDASPGVRQAAARILDAGN